MPENALTVKAARPAAAVLLDLLAHERPRLERIALRLARGGAADAEELLQGALERALARPARVAGCDRRAALSRLADLMRTEARRLHRRAAREAPCDALEAVAGGPDPLEAAIGREEARGRLAALAELTPGERRTLALLAEGRSQGEVGRLTGRSAACVAKAAERARARLAEHHREIESGARCRRARRLGPAHRAGGLPPARRRALAAHLRACPACARLLGGPAAGSPRAA